MNTYKTHNVCSRSIDFEVENNIVTDCKFNGGCAGNTQGVARLVEGLDARDAIGKLAGIRCGFKATSCPDQLAKALTIALAEEEKRKQGA